ncbi:hypothetical protein [Paucibacter sp. DJ2R-2]|uniref:hypothetical protein n=1 Tax=unclassified Roseateles TaxID=2626991 RepID=UPI0021E37FC0|nr:hypothetical protein [Paucibacter sp. DJ2R-2]
MPHLETLSTPISQWVGRLIQGLRQPHAPHTTQAIEGLDVSESTWQEWLDTIQATPEQGPATH